MKTNVVKIILVNFFILCKFYVVVFCDKLSDDRGQLAFVHVVSIKINVYDACNADTRINFYVITITICILLFAFVHHSTNPSKIYILNFLKTNKMVMFLSHPQIAFTLHK